MKNTLKKFLETQIPIYRVSKNILQYEFNKKPMESSDWVQVTRGYVGENVPTDVLYDVDQDDIFIITDKTETNTKLVYNFRINGTSFYISVTKEEDLYFQSLMQQKYKEMQLKRFELINDLLSEPLLTPNKAFDKAQENLTKNDTK